tara:strand:- start:3806 stop:4963 length:1158 start_codon:yes stop_codon:yes gene_type:complete
MPYINNRIVHDADSHTMELPDWYDDYGTDRVKEVFKKRFEKSQIGALDNFASLTKLHKQKDYRELNEKEIMLRKNYQALGAFNSKDRSEAVDHLGVATQLVFPTSPNVWLEELEHRDDLDFLYETASSTNKSQINFCKDDKRLLSVAYVPLADLNRAEKAAKEALDLGAKALLVPWACPKNHSTSHIELDKVWVQAEEAGVPILFHVGVADKVLPVAHKNNGLPEVADFHGGEENFRSISYMAISNGPMQALSLLILDGVLDRFPNLKIGVIELGAVWMPGFMRQLDAAFEAFGRHEERLQNLKLKPSEYITRQVKVTPYPTEPTEWIIKEAGTDIFMFSSDYPHVEGGRNPMSRFERATKNLSESDQDKFFRSNFEDLMGSAFK